MQEFLESARPTKTKQISVDEVLAADNPGAEIETTSERREALDDLAAARRSAELVNRAIETQKQKIEELRFPASRQVVKELLEPEMTPILKEIRRSGASLIEAFRKREELLDAFEQAGGGISTLPEIYQRTSLEFWLRKIACPGNPADIFLQQIGAK